MHLLALVILSCRLYWSHSLVSDMVIQFQYSGVVGGEENVHVLVNGLNLSNGGDLSSILRDILPDGGTKYSILYGLMDMVVNRSTVNQTIPKNHSLLRTRQCRIQGSQVYLSDHILYNGRLSLALDGVTDTWTSEAPEAHALKLIWNQNLERTRQERMQLQEGCIKLMKQLTPSESKTGVFMVTAMATVLALLAFIGLMMISFLISKKQGSQPGGVLGSIVHYPADSNELPQERKDYQIL